MHIRIIPTIIGVILVFVLLAIAPAIVSSFTGSCPQGQIRQGVFCTTPPIANPSPTAAPAAPATPAQPLAAPPAGSTPTTFSAAAPAPQDSGQKCGNILPSGKQGVRLNGTFTVQPGCIGLVDTWDWNGVDHGHVFTLEPGTHTVNFLDGKISPVPANDKCNGFNRALEEYRRGSGGTDPKDLRKPAGC